MKRLVAVLLALAPLLVTAGPAAAADPSGAPYRCPNGGPNATKVERVQWLDITELRYTVVGSDTLCSPVPDACPLGARTSIDNGTISIQCGTGSNLLFFCPTSAGWYRAWILSNFTADGGHVGGNQYGGIVPTPKLSQAGTIAELTYLPGFTAVDADILRLYQAFFDRKPDLAGAKYWLATARAGVSLDVIAYSFFASAEFQQRYGNTTNDEYLRIVYQNVLGRNYDQEGFDYWLDLLDTGHLHRGGVVRWIAAGQEFRAQHPYPDPGSRPTGTIHADPAHPCTW